MKNNKYLLFILLFLLLNGCRKNTNEGNNAVNKIPVQNNINVKIITDTELDSVIENRYGRMLFINVWATWAEPSVKQLKDIKLLYGKFENQDVDFLSLSVDLTSKINSLIIPFIKKEKINFPVKVVEEKSGLKIMKRLSPKWNGAVPASFLFDKYGKREITIIGRQSFYNLDKGIDSVRVL